MSHFRYFKNLQGDIKKLVDVSDLDNETIMGFEVGTGATYIFNKNYEIMNQKKTLPPGEEELINIDLDVKKVLDQFPNNNHDSYVYIRAHFEDKQPKNDIRCSVNAKGAMQPLILGFVDFMSQDQVNEDAIMNAVVNYLAINQERVPNFLHGLEKAVNNYKNKKGKVSNG